MGQITEKDFYQIFFEIKKCRSSINEIHSISSNQEENHPIQKLRESSSLCSGAFYQLFQCQRYYKDFNAIVKNNPRGSESWEVFDISDNLQEFSIKSLHPSIFIKKEFGAMSIANAAFRLSAAGELVCEVIQKIDLNEHEICKTTWPYQRFFQPSNRNWNRALLHGKNKKCIDFSESNTSLRNLSVLVALRDEYGHSEYDEGHECRTKIRDDYGDQIIDAEIEMLQTCTATICYLCEHHKKKLTKN
jgi:hypothetical protein